MMPRLSVIIPTLNEAHTLPRLLDALGAQTRPPDEIVVADAGSQDGTADLARARGVTVVVGRRAGPGPGRNDGARAATGDLFMFLDADVLPGPDFVASALEEFSQSGFDVATCLIKSLEKDLSERVLTEAVNLYFQMVQPFSPHAPGFCILVRRDIHEAIGGFDEAVKMAEDHDYAQRAARHGEFGTLTSVHLPVSMRRVEKEGLTQLAFKYIWCEMHALAGKPIYSTPFEYEFGVHLSPDSAPPSRPVIDLTQLRAQLGRSEDPLQRLSAAGLDHLDRLFHRDWVDSARERFRIALDPSDWLVLYRYLRRRLTALRRTGRPWRETFSRFKTKPFTASLPGQHHKKRRPRSGGDGESGGENDEKESE
jgi:glycosyl transferase family 2